MFRIMKNESYKEIIIEGLSFVFGVFLYALCFNMFLNPNNFVVSGFSGIATVVESKFGWDVNVFILITNLICLVISFIFLGWELT